MRRWWCVVLCCAVPLRVTAQRTPWLPLDTVLAPTARIGCEALPPLAPRLDSDSSGAVRNAWRDAQDALLAGDRARARPLLERVVRGDPLQVRAWLELSTTLAAAGERDAARTAACRVLLLPGASAAQRQSAEAQWSALLTADLTARQALAVRRHREGLHFAALGNWRAAHAAFDDVVRAMPTAAGAWRNRGIVAAEAGARAEAEQDLEQYLQLGAPAPERVLMARALEAVRRPRFGVGRALFSALVPGGAQFYTQRRALGVLVLSAAAGAGAWAVLPRTEERTVPYLDPNGVPAPYVETVRRYPYKSAGLAAVAAIMLGAAVEGAGYAARSARLPVLVSPLAGLPAAGAPRGAAAWAVGVRLQGR